MEYHPIASIFPLLEGQEFEDLKANIQRNGLIESVTVFEGKILDGRNRHRACTELGINLETRKFTGTALEAVERVWSLNRVRRHLNPSQAAIAEARREQMHAIYAPVREAAKEREKAGKGSDGSGGRGRTKNPRQLIAEGLPDERKTDAIRAAAAGTNREYVRQADRLVREKPDLAAAVERGEKTLSQVAREMRKEELSKNVSPLPSGKYRVIYADPPWQYGDTMNISKDGLSEDWGAAKKHYPTMAIKEICAMPIVNIVEENAVLFLWTTSPMLESSFQVVKAWGFKYKTSFVWDKVKHGMGHYNSVRHEFLLVCTRGSCTPDLNKLFDSVQTIERSKKHSEKPEEFRIIIETLYTHGKKLELFGRKEHKGWTTHGNEI